MSPVAAGARALLLAAVALAVLPSRPGPCQPAPSMGLILAAAGEELSAAEAAWVDALVAELVARGLQTAFLHEASPLLRAGRTALPSVSASDDWTPVSTVLDRLASRLQLDYVALVAAGSAEGEGAPPRALVVVRGGASRMVSLSAPAPEGAGSAAALAERLVRATDELPEPAVATEEPLPTPIPSAEPAAEVSAPQSQTQPGAAPQPAAELAAAQEGEGEVADPLAAARAAYGSGEPARALELLKRALQESGPSAELFLLRAKVHVALHLREQAVEDLTRAVALDPTAAEARVWLGRLLAEMGLWQSAIEHYEQAVAVAPTDLEALLGLARVYRDHGHRRKAVALLSDALEAGQADPALLMLLAELHELEGDAEAAERYLQQAATVATGERGATILEQLGDLHAARGEHREALAYYLAAAERSPSHAAMLQRRYREVMAAADSSVQDALTTGWSAFADYVHNGVGEREVVYGGLSQVRAQLEEALRFVDGVHPPEQVRAEHVRRQFAYSLAVEATVAALSYVDLGTEGMMERAELRQREALAELSALRSELGAAGD